MRPAQRPHRILAILAMLCAAAVPAQTLARPGWAGSGITPEPWWRHATVYRLDAGQLPTLAQLPSLAAFGIDAVLLTPQSMQPPAQSPAADPSTQPAPLTLDDFLFECSRLRIRVIVPIDVTSLDHDSLLALTTSWLHRGAAGFVLIGVDKLPRVANSSAGSATDANVTPGPVHLHRHSVAPAIHLAAAEPALVTELRHQLLQFPGDRILIGEPTTDPIANAMPSLQLRIVSLGTDPADDPSTDTRLAAYSTLASPHPLLSLTPKDGVLTPVDAALLLANDQPAILDSSVITPAILEKVFPPLASMAAPETPRPAEPPPPPPPPSNVYGAYKAYVPKADTAAAERKRKAEAERLAAEKATITLDTFPVQPLYEPITPTPEGAVAFFHRLVQLHRSNATLHDATLYDLDTVPNPAIAWTGLHTGVPPIVIVCNPGNADIRVDLSTDLQKLHLGRNMARTLLHTGAASGLQPVESITVPPHGVYIGELQRGSSYGR